MRKANSISKSWINDFLNNFGYWLKTAQKCNHNTAMKYLSNFKKIALRCVRAKWLPVDPFDNFKVSLDEVTKDVLSEDELGRIYAKQLFLDRLDLVCDIFLFSYYTGLAYADVSNLNYYDIQPGVNGQKWIFINRQKINILFRIPLLPFALKLIEKHKDHPKCQMTGKVFPILYNQKMNSLNRIIRLKITGAPSGALF